MYHILVYAEINILASYTKCRIKNQRLRYYLLFKMANSFPVLFQILGELSFEGGH